jgi:putative DNA methylase
VGAGLRAFTRFAQVEYANGEEVPAERFLAEVETVVLETILGQLSNEVSADGSKHSLAGLDSATRFYLLWRYTYRNAELDAGEAIVFANGTHVELDGPHGLSSGGRRLVNKKKSKYALLDYADRGNDEKLGLPKDDGEPAPLIDVLHRVLWLVENQPREIGKFLIEAGPNRDQMRLLVQALTGPALKGGELSDISPTGELAVLAKLASNWRSVVDDAITSAREREDRRVGQRDFFGRG